MGNPVARLIPRSVRARAAVAAALANPVAFEVVGSNNTVLASSADLQPLETNGPVLPGLTKLDTIRQPVQADPGFKPDSKTVTLGDAPAGVRTRLANRTSPDRYTTAHTPE